MPDHHPPPNGCWIDERLVVRRSQIEGQGLFFSDDVHAGDVVIRLGGCLVPSIVLDDLIVSAERAGQHVDTMTIYEDAHLVLPAGTLIHFGNHSCDPALWFVGAYEIATRREVVADVEATVDYGTLSGAAGFEMDCRCGSTQCRGRITSGDWRRNDLQERYRSHWVPELERRISAEAMGAP